MDWAFSQHVSEMTVLTRPLNADGWQLNYDVVAKHLFVSSSTGQQLSIDELLASEFQAQNELELLIMDSFPNTKDDVDAA